MLNFSQMVMHDDEIGPEKVSKFVSIMKTMLLKREELELKMKKN